ncbi:MAG: hypothetical protein ACTSRK_21160 [Promethearchaeota archaeon]
MKFRNYGIGFAIAFIICFNIFTPVLAEGIWGVEQGGDYEFNITTWEDGDVKLDGYLKLTIEDTAPNGELTYSIVAYLDVDEASQENSLEEDSKTVNNSIKVWSTRTLVKDLDDSENFISTLDDSIQILNDNYDGLYGANDSHIFTMERIEYGWVFNFEDTELEITSLWKLQYDEIGILKHWESTYTENGEKSGMLIKKKGIDILGFINSIPGYPIGISLGIFAISTIGILILQKKRK